MTHKRISRTKLSAKQQQQQQSRSPLCASHTRQLSLEEVQDLENSDSYFGKSAKKSFFTQYRALYSRPYLFVDQKSTPKPLSSASMLRNLQLETTETQSSVHDPDADDQEAGTTFVPAYPAYSELRQVEKELHPPSSSASTAATTVVDSALPTRDRLSPRSLFLTSCVNKPYLAVPFMLRKRMTKVFDFSFQSLGDEFICEFAKCVVQDLPFVEEILVRDNRLSDDGLRALLCAIAQGSSMLNLVRLDISQNEIGPKSARLLYSYVASSHCSLRMLHIDNADIDDHECASFMMAFEKNLSIKKLWMSRNCIGKAEHLNAVQPDFTTGGEAIAGMLHSNLVLEQLDLSWNYLRLASSITLARSIRDNHTLTELNLAYNACADAGAMVFGEALRHNQCLEVLDLSYNSIGCKGAMVLANAIRLNTTLRSLQLNGNNLGREGGQLLMVALCENQCEAGCDIGLRACNLGSAVSGMSAAKPPRSSLTANSAANNTAPVDPVRGGGGSAAQSVDFNMNDLSLITSTSDRIFNPKEPSGRYLLHLTEAYDQMIVMELVRLATVKKGCRFLRIDHRVTPTSAKKPVHVTRKERPQTPSAAHAARSLSTAGDDPAQDNSLATRGLELLFAGIDRDKSGSVDQQELLAVLNRIGLFPKTENLTSVLQHFDYNASGVLEQGEFSDFFFHAVFQLIDSNQSGKIDADEVEEAFKMLGIHEYDEKEILEAIATFDISGDGEMEESEFVEFMKERLLDRIKEQLLGAMPAPHSNGSEHESEQQPLFSLIDTATLKPWAIPEDGVLEIEFLFEREAFATNDEAYRQCKISQTGIEQLIRNITALAASKSEQDELFRVAIHDSDIKFTASQAYQVLEACGYMRATRTKIEMIALMLLQMLTAKEAQILVSRTLTIAQRCRLKTEMGSAYSVVLGNPTAHYAFDLAKPKDRIALNKIAEVAQSEKLFSKLRSGRADTSQHGNWENFRNEELDGRPIVLTNAFFHVLPARGRLCFDYVSTARPKRTTAPMSSRRFEQLIQVLRTNLDTTSLSDTPAAAAEPKCDKVADAVPSLLSSSSDHKLPSRSSSREGSEIWKRTRKSVAVTRGSAATLNFASVALSVFQLASASKESVALKLVQIESAVCDRWLSCDQAAQIVACMPTAFNAKPETARLLFSRVIDLDAFYKIYDALSREDQRICLQSLGWLNLMNPMAPERFYALDLSVPDEREMAKLLVELAIAEPGENWLNQKFSLVQGEPGIPGWKLPVRWEKEDGKDGGVNRSGFVELEYYAGQDRGCAPVMSFRKTLLTRTLCGTKRYCL